MIGGDKLRIYQICKSLSKHFKLTLISLCDNEDELNYQVPDDGVFSRVERVYLSKIHSYFNTLLAIPTRTPLQVAYYRSAEFLELINQLLPEHDCVFSHLIRTGDYVLGYKTPKVLEMTDAISLNYTRVKSLNGFQGLKSFIYSFEVNRLLKYERNIINKFDLSVLVSNTDKEFLLGNNIHENVLVCSNGVDLSGLPFSLPSFESKVIVFIGNMRSVQNLDACFYFCEEIMPLLIKMGNYRFRIVGSISEELKERFLQYQGVEVTGKLDSIPNAVKDAFIGVCPMRIGAGVQNKILEYMALGLPTVTTSIGLEGIDAIPDIDLLIANTPQEFLQKIEYLYLNRQSALDIAYSARAFVEKHHQWDCMLHPLLDRIHQLID